MEDEEFEEEFELDVRRRPRRVGIHEQAILLHELKIDPLPVY